MSWYPTTQACFSERSWKTVKTPFSAVERGGGGGGPGVSIPQILDKVRALLLQRSMKVANAPPLKHDCRVLNVLCGPRISFLTKPCL